MRTITLNSQQLAFIDAYLHGETQGCGAAAARAAGYAEGSARQIAHKLLQHDAVRAAINRRNRAEIGDLSSLSIRRLRQILEDDKAPYKIWLEAIKTTLDRDGIIAPKASEPMTPERKPIDRMSIDELDEYLSEIRARIAKTEAQMIDVTPAAVDEAAEPPASIVAGAEDGSPAAVLAG